MEQRRSSVRWMFHATAMAERYDDLLQPLASLFGCRVLHDNRLSEAGMGRRGGMVWLGDNSIEIGEPFGVASPVTRFLERFGGGMHSVALQVDDLDAELARLHELGVRTADRPMPGVAFTRPQDTCGLLLQWHSNHHPDDPRWGNPLPAPTSPAVLDVERVAFVAAMVKNPVAVGDTLATILNAELHEYGRVDHSVPECAVPVGDCMLAIYRRPSSEECADTWGRAHVRPRFFGMGLQVTDLGEVRRRIEDAGYEVGSTTSNAELVMREGTLPISVVLSSRLLAGTPGRPTRSRVTRAARRHVHTDLP